MEEELPGVVSISGTQFSPKPPRIPRSSSLPRFKERMGILRDPSGRPSLGLPFCTKEGPQSFLSSSSGDAGEDRRGWGTSGPAVRGPGIRSALVYQGPAVNTG